MNKERPGGVSFAVYRDKHADRNACHQDLQKSTVPELIEPLPQPHLFTAPFDPQFYPATMSSEDFQTKQLEANPQGHTHPTYTTSGTDLGRATTIGGHPADSSQIGFPIQHRKLGSPLPLGLFAFATTTFA